MALMQVKPAMDRVSKEHLRIVREARAESDHTPHSWYLMLKEIRAQLTPEHTLEEFREAIANAADGPGPEPTQEYADSYALFYTDPKRIKYAMPTFGARVIPPIREPAYYLTHVTDLSTTEIEELNLAHMWYMIYHHRLLS